MAYEYFSFLSGIFYSIVGIGLSNDLWHLSMHRYVHILNLILGYY